MLLLDTVDMVWPIQSLVNTTTIANYDRKRQYDNINILTLLEPWHLGERFVRSRIINCL